MMYAIDIMSRNKEGHFQWSAQLVSILNAMGDLSVNEASSVEELLKAVERLDPDIKRVLFGIKVNFKKDFKDLTLKEEDMGSKESSKFFYIFTTVVVFTTAGLILHSGNSNIDPETLQSFMKFGLAIINILNGSPPE